MNFRQTILVVDDDAFIRRPLEFILRQEGFDPVTADGGPACMEQLAATRPDLIIMDVMMPGTDGFELCKTIKRESRFASIPIILLSARNRDLDRRHGGGEDQMSPRGLSTSCATFQLLTRREIERRIQDVVSEVSIPVGQDPGSDVSPEGFRWIAAADLVRRMRPHLVFN